MHELFRKVAQDASRAMGAPWAFALACFLTILWAISGPFFNYSDTWQLVINTATTVLTFLMVFLIQNTQNRDAHAIHLKLDELIKTQKEARNQLIDVEDLDDEQLEILQKEFVRFKQEDRVSDSR
jgi:low affinity Fe/Cu permease